MHAISAKCARPQPFKQALEAPHAYQSTVCDGRGIIWSFENILHVHDTGRYVHAQSYLWWSDVHGGQLCLYMSVIQKPLSKFLTERVNI